MEAGDGDINYGSIRIFELFLCVCDAGVYQIILQRNAEIMLKFPGKIVFFYGMVDCEEEGKKCGEYLNSKGIDLIFAHADTYVTSASVLPVHQICNAPVVILNLQPTA